MSKIVIYIGLVILCLPIITLAEKGKGGYPGAYMELTVEPRPAAMGGAYIAVSDDAAGQLFNPAGLKSAGQNLYEESQASGAPIIGTPNTEGFGSIVQGYVESSNADVVEELVNMIVAQRAYEISSKGVQAADDMMATVNTLKR